MSRRPAALLLLMAGVAMLVAAPALAAEPTPAKPQVLFHLQDKRLDEASGLAVGHRSPGVLYAQNDSGDTNRFFALDGRTGATAAVVTVPGATNVDWEDIACAPDRRGRSSVWIADTGQNTRARNEIRVYRVREPGVARTDRDRAITASEPDVWRLRYPGAGADAESLAVAPDGTAYLVTKSLRGASQVYRLPPDPDAGRVQTLTRVGAIQFRPTGTPGGPPLVGPLTATSAAISRDGRFLAVRTYTDAYLWPLTAGAVTAAALRRTPTRVALPAQNQGEGLAIDGDRLLLDSEGSGTAVYAVTVPALARATPSSTASSPTATSPKAASPRPSAASSSGAGRTHHGFSGPVLGAVVAAGLFILGVRVAAQYARRRSERR